MTNIYFTDEEIKKNDVYFICYMIERVARKLHQHNKYVVNKIGKEQLEHLISVANVLHSENPLAVEDDWIEGYDLAEGDEPGFDDWNIGVKDGKEGSSVQAYGGFYDGIVSDENGNPVYEDGSSLKEDEQGQIISHYVDEDGNLEYVASIGVADWKDSLLGKTIVCKLKDLGTLYKTRFTLAQEGNWDFEIKLPDVSTASNIKVAKGIENTPFTVDDVELSPISIKINYSVNGEVTFKEDTNQVPQFLGVILKDGKKISFLGDAGGTGYNEAMTEAYTLSSFVQVIEPDQVQAIILRNDDGEQIEIPIR